MPLHAPSGALPSIERAMPPSITAGYVLRSGAVATESILTSLDTESSPPDSPPTTTRTSCRQPAASAAPTPSSGTGTSAGTPLNAHARRRRTRDMLGNAGRTIRDNEHWTVGNTQDQTNGPLENSPSWRSWPAPHLAPPSCHRLQQSQPRSLGHSLPQSTVAPQRRECRRYSPPPRFSNSLHR